MTTLARHPEAICPGAPPWATGLRLVVRWRALDPRTWRPFTLEWIVRSDDAGLRAGARLIDADGSRRTLDDFATTPILWTRDPRLHLDHFDAVVEPGDIPALNVSVCFEGDAPKLIFARTAAFAALGLPGGRYEPEGAALLPDDD